MSTYITVTSGNSALVDRVKQVQHANRAAQLERENDTALQAEAASEMTAQVAQDLRPIGGQPDTSVRRSPAAQRKGGFGLLFQCSFVDAPGTIWSDGSTYEAYSENNTDLILAQLLANNTDPTDLDEIDVTVPAYTADSWYSFNLRSPMAGGVLKRRYLPFTGREDGPVHIRYGYGGLRLNIPTSGTTSLSTVIRPKFETIYSDSLRLNRYPFHAYPEIHGARVDLFAVIDDAQTIRVENGGPTIAVGDVIRIAPDWARTSGARSWISTNLIPILETDYTVTSVSVGTDTTVYGVNAVIYDGAASNIPAHVYKSYSSWSDVPIDEVRWRAAESVLADDLPSGNWVDRSTAAYSSSVDSTQATAGTAWTYVDARRDQVPASFRDIVATGSGLTVSYPTDEAFAAAANTWVVRQGVYRFTNNTDRLLVRSEYGPYTYNPDLAPDTDYTPRSGPWIVNSTTADYDAQLFTVLLRQGDHPNYQYFPVEIPFASLAPLLSPGFGNTWTRTTGITSDYRGVNPPGTYSWLLVRIIG